MAFEDGFVEFMVEKKTTTKDVIIRGLSWGLMAAVLIAPYPFFGSPIYIPMALFIEIFLWLGYRYFVIRHTNTEYEYSYCDKEITIDRIMNKEKRKTIFSCTIDRMNVLAPVGSYHLDGFKPSEEKDFSSGTDGKGYAHYVLICDEKKKILLDLSPEFVKIVQNNAPRKVFTA